VHWTTSAGNKTVGAALLSIVHRRRIVREWQVHDRWSLANAESSAAVSVAQGILSGAAQRFRIPWEYGETRVTLAQASPDSLPTAVAPPALAGHRLAILWHQLWNLRMSAQETEGYAPGSTIHWPGQRMPSDELQSTINLLLAPFADPAMFVERIIASSTGIQAALQWRLVGRHVQSAWGVPASGHRLTLKGLSFFELNHGKIRSEHCCFDLLTLLEQLALREAP
jgi:predicted ester cyclase